MDNKDIKASLDNVSDFIAMLWNGLESAIEVIPPIIRGFIVLALILLWAFKKVRN